MKIDWHPIETHPKDEYILCASFDKSGKIVDFGIYRWDTSGWQQRHVREGKDGLWLNLYGCDGCWREQPDFTHWAYRPKFEVEDG